MNHPFSLHDMSHPKKVKKKNLPPNLISLPTPTREIPVPEVPASVMICHWFQVRTILIRANVLADNTGQ